MRTRLLLALAVGGLALPMLDPAAHVALAAGAASAAPTGCVAPTAAAVGGLFDEAVPAGLARTHVPGAAVSVVSGDHTVFSKGYGLADIERGIPFSGDRTLVRIASITKLFTWTAVMQQVEAGRLDLNADVNHYLSSFKVPATYPDPVTLQDLMDHTAGFENTIIGTGARTAEDVAPLRDYLADSMPARIRPPGVISAYSNYGAGLAGYIVSQVSGEPYDQYVQRHLLDPLGMAHSTATEPIPAGLAGDLARSYNTDETPPRAVPFIFDQMPPDGSISASATDMAAFMTAHLRPGKLLSPATQALMHTRSFTADPRIDGYAHGFKERTFNGHRVLMHDGGWEGFVSGMLLVPDCDLGLFMSANGTGGSELLGDLLPRFFDRFTPATGVDATPAPSTGDAPQAGFYKPTSHSESRMEKLLTLLGPARLTVDGDGTVHFGGADWTPVGGGRYRKADGLNHLAHFTGTGSQRYLVTDSSAYELMPASETLPVNLTVLAAFTVAALSAIALPIAAGVRRLRRRPTTITTAWRAARWLAAGAAALGFAFLALLLTTLLGNTSAFIYGAPLGFRLLLALPLIVLAAAVAATALTVRGWRGSDAGALVRVHQGVLLAALAALAWFLWQWNLIGWQLG
jgi:CubicO group peptidase (beta-lactamase class C family)